MIDGDTIVLNGGERVRLLGIDSPESVNRRQPIQCFAREASKFLSDLTINKVVRVEHEGRKKDRYGRTVAYVYLEDGTLLNAVMVERGFAFAYLKYPFSRSEQFSQLENVAQRLQRKGYPLIPLPAATQWQIVEETALVLEPVWKELIRQAAQGRLVHNDDTRMRILCFQRETSDSRTGLFTSGIVSILEGRRIATFFTGRKHAGENLADLLRQRAAELAAPIQMCDALSRNAPSSLRVILSNCLAHARRHFIDVVKNFPAECRYVLDTLRAVFHHDGLAREQLLTPEQRLRFHQQHSLPLMDGPARLVPATVRRAEGRTEFGVGPSDSISPHALAEVDSLPSRGRRSPG